MEHRCIATIGLMGVFFSRRLVAGGRKEGGASGKLAQKAIEGSGCISERSMSPDVSSNLLLTTNVCRAIQRTQQGL